MQFRQEMRGAFDVSNISEEYHGNIEITDLKEVFGTNGHILVVRGDMAYVTELGKSAHVANPKFWLYEILLGSPRIREQLAKHPHHSLFDGVGFSSLEALCYHAKLLGRSATVVMPHEFIPEPELFDRYTLEVINADGTMEQGYVKKQAEVLAERTDLIPLHQALYGAQALAPVGNKIVKLLEDRCITPEETFWCIASGSNLYGIGSRIKAKFDKTKIVAVEPSENPTIDPSLDLSNPKRVRAFARHELNNYELPAISHSGIIPLHLAHLNRYLLLDWRHTGKTGIDRVVRIPVSETLRVQERLRIIDPDYDWTKTTALTLVPAIASARDGKDVLVMSYGKNRKNMVRDGNLEFDASIDTFPALTPKQKFVYGAAVLSWFAFATYYCLNSNPTIPYLFAPY